MNKTDEYNRGVAVGSSIGHAIGGFFGGGSSAPAEQSSGAVTAQGQSQEQNSWEPRSCEVDAKQFTKCLDENQGNMQICSWYLEQLVCIYSILATAVSGIITNATLPLES